MKHKLLIGFVIISTLCHTSIRSIWTAYYYAYKSEFVQACINRDKPELHCDGKCALMDRMEDQEEDLPFMPKVLVQLEEMVCDLPQNLSHRQYLDSMETSATGAIYWSGLDPDPPVSGIFKPPS